jgi:hypothetical protein
MVCFKKSHTAPQASLDFHTLQAPKLCLMDEMFQLGHKLTIVWSSCHTCVLQSYFDISRVQYLLDIPEHLPGCQDSG